MAGQYLGAASEPNLWKNRKKDAGRGGGLGKAQSKSKSWRLSKKRRERRKSPPRAGEEKRENHDVKLCEQRTQSEKNQINQDPTATQNQRPDEEARKGKGKKKISPNYPKLGQSASGLKDHNQNGKVQGKGGREVIQMI